MNRDPPGSQGERQPNARGISASGRRNRTCMGAMQECAGMFRTHCTRGFNSTRVKKKGAVVR